MRPALLPIAAVIALSACQPGADEAAVPGDRKDDRPFSEISAKETVRFLGTEPFWGGAVTGDQMTYETPDKPAGERITVARFAGRGGLSFSGKLADADLTMTITPGACSDGMSDRRYPFTVTLQIGTELRSGCGYSDAHPFEGPAAP